ncbi:hypothetical protein [Dyella terrae]|uniref:Uncharacterized protein n=1 Tax=Dyella terrae TaxID=522259 RepID=A0ABY1YP83_9GAMM|nr:hypothetical protein [Dyella terrae]TBR35968.1 hypothetical protein EYV96_18445 [Dyella terrae]
MPMATSDLNDTRRRVMLMLADTIDTFEVIGINAPFMFGDAADRVRAAIDECLGDVWRRPADAGLVHPEALIFATPLERFQRAGFYGAQLDLKEQQVTRANRSLREAIASRLRGTWIKPFRKWIDAINNFLTSLIGASGIPEALKELKDCLRDELEDDEP